MLKVNKKILKGICAFTLVGTCLLSTTGCSNGIPQGKIAESGYLEGKYVSGGYYLLDTSFEGLLAIEVDGKLKIVDEELKSIYSNETYDGDSYDSDMVVEVYKFLNPKLVSVNDLSNKDFINIEKYINGEKVDELSKLSKVSYKDLIIDDYKYYDKKSDINWYQADLSEIEVFFLDGKADRIVRCLKCYRNTGNTERAMDIISGAIVDPSYDSLSKTSTFDRYAYKDQGHNEYEFVPISDLFPEIIKTRFTGDDIVELFYLIQGRTKDEVKAVLTVYNQTLPTNEPSSIKEVENTMVKK